MAPQLILTCHHVVPDEATAADSLLEFDYHENEDGTFGKVTSVSFDHERVFISEQRLDFTLISLREPLFERPHIPLIPTENAMIPGELISIFHHPQGGPLEVGLRVGELVSISDYLLHHTADTQPGSAGAPLFNEYLQLVGLHHAAISHHGTTPLPNETIPRGAGEAIQIRAIVAEINRRSPGIGDELASTSLSDPWEERKSLSDWGAKTSWESAIASGWQTVEVEDRRERNTVFISYAHADQGRRKWRERLRTFLAPFGREIDIWDDSRIQTGAQWKTELNIALR